MHSEPENDQEPTVDEPPVEAQPVEDSVAKESANEEPLVVETSPVEYISAQDDDTEGEVSILSGLLYSLDIKQNPTTIFMLKMFNVLFVCAAI